VPLLDRRHRLALAACSLLWAVLAATFAHWWLGRSEGADPAGFIVTTIVLFTFLFGFPGAFLFFVNRARRPAPELHAPPGLRVAMVVTKTPAEPWALVRHTLEAMLGQQGAPAYEVWLADEDPEEETLEWCARNRVGVTSRRDHPDYHRDTWPRRRRSKEGNLAYFYDQVGYHHFDVVCQFDADHAPEPDYLRHILPAFADRRVGYVGAPSICDRNARSSWTARGRLYEEAPLHGPVQAGATIGFAPSAIGSHYAVRTAALKEIGGLGPELAEDFSTSLLMNAAGWKGAFAVDAIAHGLGPATIADCVTQELQWSRSMMTLLLTIGPRAWIRLSILPKLRLGFCLLWYPLASTLGLLGVLLPLWAVARESPLVSSDLGSFLARICLLDLATLAAVAVLRHAGALRPSDAPVLSWEMILFRIIRLPWMAVGCALAVAGRISGRPVEWRITPKSQSERGQLPARVLLPPLALVAMLVVPLLLHPRPTAAGGYAFLSLAGALIYVVATLAIVHLDPVERRRAGGAPAAGMHKSSAVGTLIVALMMTGMVFEGPDALEAVRSPVAPPVAQLGERNIGAAVGGLSQNEAVAFSPAQLGDALTFERAVEARAGIVMWFSDWRQPPPRKDRLQAIVDRGSIPEITWEPWDHRLGPRTPQPRYRLARLMDGSFDAYVRAWAMRLGTHDGPVLLRFAHEMNHDAYPWGRSVEGNTASRFRAVWRHVHNIFTRAGAANVRWVWSPMATRLDFDYYPGDRYVDFVSLTGFNGGTQLDWSGWRTPTSIFEKALIEVERRLPGKPIELGEISTVADGGDRAAWMSDLFALLSRHPRVESVVWFNLVKEADWRIEPGTPEARAFAAGATTWLGEQPR
jgi:cellulose synthase (UDP-forming)